MIWVSFLSLLFVTFSAIFYWKIQTPFLIASVGKGFLVALDILFIIFGAIFFLEILKNLKIIENIGFYLESISKDLRVQVILLAWFFGNFIEGTAGFGTPATVVVPLLMGLGIAPLNAVVLSLFGNSASGVFGAAGAPIKIGFGELAGSSLTFKASLYNLVGVLVPVFMLWFLVKDKGNAKKKFFDSLPFALWSGFAFSLSSVLFSFLGPEFPSILGSVLGLIIILLTIKSGLLLPKTDSDFISVSKSSSNLSFKKVIFPYVILILLLVFGKLILGSLGVPIPILVKHTFAFFNPGFALFLAGLIVTIIYKVPMEIFWKSIKIGFKKSIEPLLVIAFMSGMVQIMVNSSQNVSGMMSMINYLSMGMKNAFLPLLSPIVGTFGSFLTGSVTVSNVMFGNLLAEVAKELSFNTDSILALALVGGAAGNMIALADVLVTETVAGIKHKEKEVIKKVIIPCLIYVLIVGMVGMVIT